MSGSGFHPQFAITHTIEAALTRIERARSVLDAATLSEDWVREMSERALVLEAHHTTHIEGTRLMLDQSKRLWAGKAVPGSGLDDARELLNFRDAFSFLIECLDSETPITEGLIRELHKHLVKGMRNGAADPGAYRIVQNQVVNAVTRETVYTPPMAHDVPRMMADLVHWLNEAREVHPVLVSGVAQFQLAHIHPFLDGNGRVSRLLSLLLLYRSGYDLKRLFTLSEYYDWDRPGFYRAIQNVRDQDMEMTRWLEYFVEGLATQMWEVTQRVEQAMEQGQAGDGTGALPLYASPLTSSMARSG